MLAGKTVVLTGTLPNLSREDAKEMLEAAGHLAPDSAGLYDPANISVVHHVNPATGAVLGEKVVSRR